MSYLIFFFTLLFQLSAVIFSFSVIIRKRCHGILGIFGGVILARIVTGILIFTGVADRIGPYVFFIHRWVLPMIMSGLILFMMYWFSRTFHRAADTEESLKKAIDRYYNIFNGSDISLTEEDVGAIKEEVLRLKKEGITGNSLRAYLVTNPGRTEKLASSIKILDVNEWTLKLFDASSKEEMIQNYYRTFTDESLDVFIDFVIALAAGENDVRRETVLKTIKGRRFQALIKISLPKDDNDTTAIVSIVDISRYKNLEEDLRKERDLAQKYLDIADVVMVVYDYRGVIRQINRKGSEVFDYDEKELLGKNWFDLFVPPEDRGLLKKKYRSIMEGRLPYNPIYEEDLLKRDGSRVRIAWRAVPLYDDFGKIEANLCSGIDVTELRNKDQELKRIMIRSQAAESLAKIGYWEIDVVNNSFFWSDANYRLLGFEPGEIVPSPELFISLVDKDDVDSLEKDFNRSVKERTEFVNNYRIHVGDEIKYIRDWAHHFYDDAGNHVVTTGLSQDITEQVESSEKLRKSLEEKNALLRELYHRTKNNMQVISAMLSLKAGEEEDIRVSAVFMEVERKIRAMALAHEKLYKSEDLSHIDFKEYFNDLVELLKSSHDIGKRNIEIVQNVEDIEGLLDIAIPCGLIVNELITNAVKYAFPGGRGGVIGITMNKDSDGYIILSVADNGIGMDEEKVSGDSGSLGIRTINALGEGQLRGTVSWNVENGVRCTVKFDSNVYAKRI